MLPDIMVHLLFLCVLYYIRIYVLLCMVHLAPCGLFCAASRTIKRSRSAAAWLIPCRWRYYFHDNMLLRVCLVWLPKNREDAQSALFVVVRRSGEIIVRA